MIFNHTRVLSTTMHRSVKTLAAQPPPGGYKDPPSDQTLIGRLPAASAASRLQLAGEGFPGDTRLASK